MSPCSALVPLVAVLSAMAPARGEKATAGQPVPDFEFRSVSGGDGRKKLSEFRGQPVLIVWYSTYFAGIEGAKIAIDLDQELNKDFPEQKLVVFLMESKGNDATYMRALQMAQLPGARCRLMQDQEFPLAYDDSTGAPPKMILIGADGTLLFAGSFQAANEVKQLLKGEVAKLEKGWGENPLASKARALAWGQWKLGEAYALLEPALGGGAPELEVLAGEIEGRFDALVRSIAYHAEQGETARVALAMSRLKTATDEWPAWSTRVPEETMNLAAASLMEAELGLELDQILKVTQKNKPKKGLDEKLRAFAAGKAAGTKVGARAARLADSVTKALGQL